jgi:TPR repeat protein
MTVLAQLPEIIGFFSYSREDDLDSDGALSTLRKRIQSELRAQLGRSEKTLRLFQDAEAIAPGTLWETQLSDAILKCSFFIPIVTPRVVGSKYCRLEFESFLAREKAIGRSDLIFPIIYIEIPELKDEQYWRADTVLNCIGQRQYVDWSDHRFELDTPRVRREIALFARTIVHALKRETSDQLSYQSLSDKPVSKQARPGTEQVAHDPEAQQAGEKSESDAHTPDGDEAPKSTAAEEKSQIALRDPENRAVVRRTWPDAERIASKLEAQHASERSTRRPVTALLVAATATLVVVIGGLSYALLEREKQPSARSQADSEPKAVRIKPDEVRGKQATSDRKAAYERAAGAGDTEAMLKLGWMYQNGLDVIQDYDKAKQYYRKARDLGDTEALNYLGSLYENGLGVVRDYNQARSFYEKAADADNATGFRNLGLLYTFGRGVSQSYDKARTLFERAKSLYEEAAAKGNAAAMTNLGGLYERGWGVGVDYDKAKSLYEQAARAGDAQAMNSLGEMYENARGTWRDFKKAKALYEQAAAAGNEQAVSNLERLKAAEKLNAAK